MSDEYLTIKEAAKILNVSRKVIARLVRDHEIRAHRNSLQVRGPAMLDRTDVQRLLAKLTDTTP